MGWEFLKATYNLKGGRGKGVGCGCGCLLLLVGGWLWGGGFLSTRPAGGGASVPELGVEAPGVLQTQTGDSEDKKGRQCKPILKERSKGTS